MMKLKSIFWGVFAVAIVLSACDEISTPIIPKQVNSTLPTTPPTYRDSNTVTYQNYKVLLEDCMGHLCSNCPAAVSVSDNLLANSSIAPHLVLIEDNMGGFAVTDTMSPLPDSALAKDYTCEAGNNWLTLFNITLFPTGLINRLGWTNSSPNMNIQYTNWQDSVQDLILQYPTPQVEINIHDSCWVPQRVIGVEFHVTFKTALPGNTYLLEPLIVQDSIFDWQNTPTGYVDNFLHRYVLRGSFDLIGVGTTIPVAASETAGGNWTSYQTYNFTTGENGKAAGWNMARCYIVVFVYNQANYQVVQAEMIKVE